MSTVLMTMCDVKGNYQSTLQLPSQLGPAVSWYLKHDPTTGIVQGLKQITFQSN